MLETIRELAVEELGATGEEQEIRGRHAGWCLGVAEAGGPNLGGSARAAWLEDVGDERENLRAALAWSADVHGDAETGLRIAAALQPFWTAHALHAEGQRVLGALLSRSEEPTVGRARALAVVGWISGIEGDVDTTERACRESLALLPAGEDWYRAVCLNLLGTMARLSGRLDEAGRRYEEALAPRHPARPLVPDRARVGERWHAPRARRPRSRGVRAVTSARSRSRKREVIAG